MWLLKRIIYLAIILAAILVGYISRNHLNRSLKMVWILLVITFCSETAAIVLAYQGSNSFLYHIFNPLETCLWGMAYYSLFNTPDPKKVTVILCVITILAMLANTIWYQQMGKQPNNYSIVAESLFLLICSLLFFQEMLRHPQEENIFHMSSFWLNCAILFFYTINILFWASYDLLKTHNKTLWRTGFQLLFYSNYVFYATIGFSFWLQKRRSVSPSNEAS